MFLMMNLLIAQEDVAPNVTSVMDKPSTWGGVNCVVNGAATISCLPGLFSLLLNALFEFSALVAVFFVIFSGLKFLMSGGDEKKVERAKQTMTYAIIGLIIIVLVIPAVNLVLNIINPALGKCVLNFGLLHC